MKRELVTRQEQKRSNNEMIREGYKKMNLAFAEYKAASEAVKIKIITAGKKINYVKNQFDQTYQNVGEMDRTRIMRQKLFQIKVGDSTN